MLATAKKQRAPDEENEPDRNPTKRLNKNVGPHAGSTGTNMTNGPELSMSVDEIMQKYTELQGKVIIFYCAKVYSHEFFLS